jgi:hypothetical protein
VDGRQYVGRHLFRMAFLRVAYEDGEYNFLFFYGGELWGADLVLCEVVEEETDRLTASILNYL